MTEFVLILWMLLPGKAISDPIEVGTYRTEAACETEGARQANDTPPVDPRYAMIWKCVERDK